MAEAVGTSREESAAMLVSVVLLAGSGVLFLLQLPAVLAGGTKFSPWIYLPAILAMFVGVWQKQDHVAWMAVAWLSIFFMIDVYYGVGFFA